MSGGDKARIFVLERHIERLMDLLRETYVDENGLAITGKMGLAQWIRMRDAAMKAAANDMPALTTRTKKT